MKNPMKSKGFTLLELLVVLSVISIVSTIGVTTFIKMATLWSDTSASMELTNKSVNVFGRIRDDFDRTASAQRTGHAIQGIDRLETERLINRHKPEDDRIIIPIYQRVMGGDTWEQIAAKYHIDRSDGGTKLMRTLGPNDGSDPAGPTQMLAENVVAMNISYLDKNDEWQGGWSQPEQPSAVRVQLSLGLANRPNEHISRETIFPIHVK